MVLKTVAFRMGSCYIPILFQYHELMLIILIAGASGAGKTFVANALLTQLTQQHIHTKILATDNYFVECPPEQDAQLFRQQTNFAALVSIDVNLLVQHIVKLSLGETIQKLDYDFVTAKRRPSHSTLSPCEVLIVEGMFSFALRPMLQNLDPTLSMYKVHVGATSYRTIIDRRKRRDIEERGRTEGIVIQQERDFLGPGFFGESARYRSNVDVDINNDDVLGNINLDKVMQMISAHFELKNNSLRQDDIPRQLHFKN
jgi:uridine kinase